MDKKNVGIIATVATVVLCGCPGLFGLCFGSIFALAGAVPGADIDIFGSSDPSSAIGFGIAILCLSVVSIAVPVVVGFMTLRNKNAANDVVNYDEPLPEDL